MGRDVPSCLNEQPGVVYAQIVQGDGRSIILLDGGIQVAMKPLHGARGVFVCLYNPLIVTPNMAGCLYHTHNNGQITLGPFATAAAADAAVSALVESRGGFIWREHQCDEFVVVIRDDIWDTSTMDALDELCKRLGRALESFRICRIGPCGSLRSAEYCREAMIKSPFFEQDSTAIIFVPGDTRPFIEFLVGDFYAQNNFLHHSLSCPTQRAMYHPRTSNEGEPPQLMSAAEIARCTMRTLSLAIWSSTRVFQAVSAEGANNSVEQLALAATRRLMTAATYMRVLAGSCNA